MKPNGYRIGAILNTLFASVVFTSGALAQDVPISTDPAQIERELEQPIELAIPPPLAVPPRSTISRPANMDEVNFDLKMIELTGFTAINLEELESVYSDRLGNNVSLSDVFDIADEITALYRRKGFVLSQAVVPAQRIEDGSVEIQIVEGFVSATTVEGVARGGSTLIRRLTETFTNQKPLRFESFERGLLLINDLPGISASSVIGKSSDGGLGAASVRLLVNHDPWSGNVSVNNRGSEALGPGRVQFSGTRNLLSGNHSQFGVGGTAALDSSELLLVNGFYDVGLDALTRLRLSASAVVAEPDLEIAEFDDLETDSFSFDVTVSRPLLRSRLENVYLDVGFNVRNSTSLGQLVDGEFGTDTETDTRDVRVGIRSDIVKNPRTINQFQVSLIQGIDGLGASDSRVQGDSPDLGYSKLEVSGSWLQALSGGFSLLVAAEAQAALTDDLPDSQLFSIGGQTFVRAYDSSAFSGRQGAAAKVELRFNRGFGSVNYNPYGYFDTGIVQGTSERLDALGLGLRFTRQKLGGYVEFGVPLDGEVAVSGRDDARLFAGLSYSF